MIFLATNLGGVVEAISYVVDPFSMSDFNSLFWTATELFADIGSLLAIIGVWMFLAGLCRLRLHTRRLREAPGSIA